MAAIYLRCQLPGTSSDHTRGADGPSLIPPIWSCSGWGLPSQPVASLLVRSYRTVSSLPLKRRFVFLWHFPLEVAPHWTLSSTLPCRSPDFPQLKSRGCPHSTSVATTLPYSSVRSKANTVKDYAIFFGHFKNQFRQLAARFGSAHIFGCRRHVVRRRASSSTAKISRASFRAFKILSSSTTMAAPWTAMARALCN